MKKFKLEDIEKKQIFKEPPNGYFEALPAIIQAQTTHRSTSGRVFAWGGILRYALPLAAVLIVAVFIGYFNQKDTLDPERMLSEVSIEAIVTYLEESEITTEELIASVDWSDVPLNFDEDWEEADILDEVELEENEILELFQEYQITEEYL